MFIHNFKYALKTLFRNKMLIFWTFAFPILLGTFFKLAFSNIENGEKLDIIDIAIVETDEFKNNEIYKETFKTLSDENSEDRLFNTQYVSLDEAKDLLENDEISGYLLLTESPKVVVMTNGINETILKFVTEEISQSELIIYAIAEKRMQDQTQFSVTNGMAEMDLNAFYHQIYTEASELLQNSGANIENISSSNLSYTMIEFYTLIAMACLYGGILGMTSINYNLANMSSIGKRVAVTPTTKSKIILSSVLASYITQLVGVALLFVYTIFVLKVDYGNNLPLIIVLSLAGCLAGLSLGIMVGTLLRSNENVKTGIVIGITMFGCFLSGMMGITMKYVIDKNIPILNKVNPAGMITDGFYSLYYYDTRNRFCFDLISLLIFAMIMILVSVFSLRRQTYDSI